MADGDDGLTLTVLGSGGNSPIPMPTCTCRVCEQARAEGIPYARHGNSLYLEELGAMVDAPEFVYTNLRREGVTDLSYVLVTHWHPDHVDGLRVVQSRDLGRFDGEPGPIDLSRAIAADKPTVVTTERVYERTREVFGSLVHFVDEVGFADVHLLDVDGPLEARGARVTGVPYSLRGDADEDAVAFVVERGGRRLLVASDDAKYVEESRLPDDVDCAVFECGLFERDPDGEQLLSDADLERLAYEPRHEEILARARRLDPGLTLLTEIGHITGRSHDDLRTLEEGYEDVRFAYDGLTVEV